MTKRFDPNELFNEKGEQGQATGFFGVEQGRYTVTLLATRRWTTPRGNAKTRRVTESFEGLTPVECAAEMALAGWEAPTNLRELCEANPPRRVRRRKSHA
jgi:hypothetical protein